MYIVFQKLGKIQLRGDNMFKVKKDEFVNKTFRIPVELLKKLEILAQNEKVSLNNLVIQCCEYALNNMKSNDSKE